MWVVAGVLLGLVMFSTLAGFFTGPHSHAFAGVLGAATAIWLFIMALSGQATPLLWGLLAADVAVSGGIGTLAWRGLTSERKLPEGRNPQAIGGAFGVATSDLDPDGLVRVKGEIWSATSLNGRIANGATIQVIRAGSVRLEVWGEDGASPGAPQPLEAASIEDLLDDAEHNSSGATNAHDASDDSDDRRAGTT